MYVHSYYHMFISIIFIVYYYYYYRGWDCLHMAGGVLVEHDVEAEPEGDDEEGVPGEEEDEASHHLVEHRHVDVVAETIECQWPAEKSFYIVIGFFI